MQYEHKFTDFSKRLMDVDEFMTWSFVARQYFDRSASWFYNKMTGRDGHGYSNDFSPEECRRLQAALRDMGQRLLATADSLLDDEKQEKPQLSKSA